MQIKKALWRKWPYLIGLGPDLSKAAAQRLRWMDYYRRHEGNVSLTCRYFGISRQTFYRWLGRFDPDDLRSLEGRSHRPGRLRHPTWSLELAQAVQKRREQYPRWGKDKLVVLLRNEGWSEVSTSMVGRILKHLKTRGALREAPRRAISARKRARIRPYAIRKPRDWRVQKPGDLVQLDTLDVRPAPRLVRKHFTARDVVSRWDVVEVHLRATSKAASLFLDTVQKRMPFPIRAFQVDGGSEFAALFEAECERRGIKLFVLPPRSPKLNGSVERAQRTHTEEFYEVQDPPLEITSLNRYLQRWENIYNTVRPHQSLGYLTPLQFLSSLHAPLPFNSGECH
jgi:putative transposase